MTDLIHTRVARQFKNSQEYYDLRKRENLTLEEVSCLWALEDKQAVDARIHGFYPVEDIWPLREYTWTKDKSRPGYARINGERKQFNGPEKWEVLKHDMKENGWRLDEQPALIDLGKSGKAQLSEGNHRMAIAREVGIEEVPVKFFFRRKVNGTQLCDEAGPPDLDELVDQVM
jgi:hypothetical protein